MIIGRGKNVLQMIEKTIPIYSMNDILLATMLKCLLALVYDCVLSIISEIIVNLVLITAAHRQMVSLSSKQHRQFSVRLFSKSSMPVLISYELEIYGYL